MPTNPKLPDPSLALRTAVAYDLEKLHCETGDIVTIRTRTPLAPPMVQQLVNSVMQCLQMGKKHCLVLVLPADVTISKMPDPERNNLIKMLRQDPNVMKNIAGVEDAEIVSTKLIVDK